MITNAEVAATCRAAASALEEHGWTKGYRFRQATGQMCLLGAVHYAAGVDVEDQLAYPAREQRLLVNATCQALCDELELPRQDSLVTWNDQKARKVQNVVGLLRTVADRMERTPDGSS